MLKKNRKGVSQGTVFGRVNHDVWNSVILLVAFKLSISQNLGPVALSCDPLLPVKKRELRWSFVAEMCLFDCNAICRLKSKRHISATKFHLNSRFLTGEFGSPDRATGPKFWLMLILKATKRMTESQTL